MLNANKQTVYYATFSYAEPLKDEYGNETSETKTVYSAPVKTAWNVRYVDSVAEVTMFGTLARDTLRIVAPKKGFPLDENSILWFGIEPPDPYDPTSPKHNYVVSGIRPGLSVVVFYARKVDVS